MPVAIRAITRIQDADDANLTLGAGQDGYAITWDNDAGEFVMAEAGGSSLPVVDETALVYKTGNAAITATFDANALTTARVYTLPNESMTLAGRGANTFTAGQVIETTETALKLRSGTGVGALLIGADVNNKTITANVRKLARFTCPSYDAGATNTMFFSADLDSGNNRAYFGGTPGGSQYGCNNLYFCTVGTQTTTGGVIAMTVDPSQNVGIGKSSSIAAKLHIDQASSTAAIPALLLDQADDSEEMIEFTASVGTGNAIEAVGAKTLTTTHFIRVTITGVGYVYIPVGTIA